MVVEVVETEIENKNSTRREFFRDHYYLKHMILRFVFFIRLLCQKVEKKEEENKNFKKDAVDCTTRRRLLTSIRRRFVSIFYDESLEITIHCLTEQRAKKQS